MRAPDYGARHDNAGSDSAAGAHAPAGSRVWRAELTETVKLALPIALTQLGQIAMMTTDLALIGRLGDQAVAAAALAHTVLFTVFVHRHGHRVGGRAARRAGLRRAPAAHGAPRAARRPVGRRHPRRAAHLVQLWGGELLVALGQSRESAALAERYLARHGVVPGAGLVLHGAAQLHGRGEPAGARAVDHARRDPGQRACSPTR